MLTVHAPAKLNLDLRVGATRADGFHPLSSWFVTTSLHDTLTFEPAAKDEFNCDDPSIPTDQRNLVVRAMNLLPHAPVKVALTKRVPAGGGLGGGSSDAAATLKALARLEGVPTAALPPLAEQLGSDVPFFLGGPSALCTGRGEAVDELPLPRARSALLVLPHIHVSTPAVFRAFDALPSPEQLPARGSARESYAKLSQLRAAEALREARNDLEAPAFQLHPELGRLRSEAESRLGRPVRMSGSGSTLFTLYDTLAEAEEAAKLVKNLRVLAVAMCPLD